MKLKTATYILIRFTWLLVGATLGAVMIMLLQARSELVLDWSLAIGIGLGIGTCLVALLAWTLVRPRAMETDTSTDLIDPEDARAVVLATVGAMGLSDHEANRLWRVLRAKGIELLALVMQFWSGAAALGMAVAIAGSVIAMITALAAIQQVNRIDTQNSLIQTQTSLLEAQNELMARQSDALDTQNEMFGAQNRQVEAQNALIEQQTALLQSQIDEARATRTTGSYAAQLPSLIAAIDAERTAWFERSKAEGPGNATPALWVPSRVLVARIQTVLDSAEPYRSYPEIDAAVDAVNAAAAEHNAHIAAKIDQTEDSEERQNLASMLIPQLLPKRFSPERGQLLQFLLAVGVDFGRTAPPLMVLNADLAGARLNYAPTQRISADFGTNGSGRVMNVTDLGRTVLAYSNLRGADLLGVDLSEANLIFSVFDNPAQLDRATTINSNVDPSVSGFPLWGTRFEGALLVGHKWLDQEIETAWLGNRGLAEDTISQLKTVLERLSGAGGWHVDENLRARNFMSYYEVEVRAGKEFDSVALIGIRPPRIITDLQSRIAFRLNILGAGECTGLRPHVVEELRDLVWFSNTPNRHPKWIGLVEMLRGALTPQQRTCIDQIGDAPRKIPNFARQYLLE